MRLLIIGGMHGNELLGVELVRSLQARPILGADALIANPRAVEKVVRFTETDLNRSFGATAIESYEVYRARELQELAKGYDVVLDFHNTQTPDNDCCFVGVSANRRLYDVAKELGFQACIQADYDCINKYCPNVLSVEISVDSDWDSVAYWRDCIARLCNMPLKSITTGRDSIVTYRFYRRVTWDEQRIFGLRDWTPFREINDHDKRSLGCDGVVVPIFIGSRLTEYYATILRRTDIKNDVTIPLTLAE